MPGSPLIVFAYVVLAVFVVVFCLRSLRMARLPVHLRWELSPVPHEKGKGRYGGSYLEEFEWWTKPREKSVVSELTYMFLEIVFLRGVWEHNRRLWWFSFPLHFGLYLLIVSGALLLVAAILQLADVTVWDAATLPTAVSVLAAAGYSLGALGAAGLLISRLTSPRLRPTNTPASIFNLVLLLAMFASGVGAVLAVDDFAGQTTAFVTALLSANAASATPGILTLHLVMVLLFLAYLPFSQMMHFVAKYFTYHQVRWDDEPLARGGHLERKVTELMEQPVTWSATHVNADGKKNWVDLASEEGQKE